MSQNLSSAHFLFIIFIFVEYFVQALIGKQFRFVYVFVLIFIFNHWLIIKR